MMQTFRPYLRMLPVALQRLWPSLRGVTDLGYVLYGETAIVLRLGHKPSTAIVTPAFDFFSERQLSRRQLYRALPWLKDAPVLRSNDRLFVVLISVFDEHRRRHSVRLRFHGYAAEGRVGEPLMSEDDIVQVASLEDLLAFKLYSFQHHYQLSDYIDICALLEAGYELDQGLAAAQLLFGKKFSVMNTIKSLTCFVVDDLPQLTPEQRRLLRKKARSVRVLPKPELVAKKISALQHDHLLYEEPADYSDVQQPTTFSSAMTQPMTHSEFLTLTSSVM